ncbi:hypothetical protein DCO58_08820 [Helicobacter saguini]|uniref:Uncharacterized protein n=1 Tax=Helicobacter saguini TaxID=1548018 RepID=A0A347VNZ1_9HELI|nr:hypothetical protein [Helicobacter saguini]MWV61577.1 hypothetical protein [Helicobacter saguini]MWV67752.1 hypothetical protein [Helicobacter saguini]MWV70780.1 hypothetical protein [Helicobacter saguini]MWV72684.1 hypothetical protein [Helicobacter saguini]TLD94514.1 hypothetical protein LS64_004920 [Helicobacter saguini]
MQKLQEIFKAAWNYQAIKKDSYTFKELLEWAKNNAKNNESVAVMRESKDSKIIIKAMLLDSNNTPLNALDMPYLCVETKNLDSDLLQHFGDKNILILK